MKIVLKTIQLEHHNVITQHAHELNQIKLDKDSKIAIKKTLDLALYKLVEKPKEEKVTEMYKIIGSARQNGDHYICRVWFTLVPIEKNVSQVILFVLNMFK